MRQYFFTLLLWLCLYLTSSGQTVGTGLLSITFNDLGNGVTVSNIQRSGTDILHVADEIFTLFVRNTTNQTETSITSSANWGNASVTLSNGNTDCTITLSNPSLINIPATLVAIVMIHTNGSQSEWDLQVTGLGPNHSLLDVHFPHLIVKGDGGQFLIPRFSGKEISNPAAAIDYIGLYPRGWGASMQFMAYYDGNSPSVYFGFHDPTAATKTFRVLSTSGGVSIECQTPIPNKKLVGNNWNFPGHFALDLLNGDWWDASTTYRDWAADSANYWPGDPSPAQQVMGKIGVWGNTSGILNGSPRAIPSIQNEMQDFIDAFPNVPVGMHYYEWFGHKIDSLFPELFPAIPGTSDLFAAIQDNNDAYITPYFNGWMYDTSLVSYAGTGKPDATKNEDGSDKIIHFGGRPFAIMCPTQSTWQDIIRDACIDLNTLGAKGIYLDQVSGASPQQCMDITHGHPLGGGPIWRDGYAEMLDKVKLAVPGNFITVEGGNDYLADKVDGFYTGNWVDADLVPAFQLVYAGKVQFFATNVYARYTQDDFYAKLAQSFSFGIQPGRFFSYLANDPNAQAEALPYARKLATLRAKLYPFIAFGDMHRSPTITAINPIPIPDITTVWVRSGADPTVTISALQTAVRQSGDTVMVSLVNASRVQNLEFSFTFLASQYGLTGPLKIREVTETSDGTWLDVNNSFTQSVKLPPLDARAFVISACSCGSSFVNTWVGPTNGNWLADPANWSSGSIPSACDDVVIPAGNVVNILNGENARSHTLEVQETAELNVDPGADLEVFCQQ